jgi:hypothetical protein
MGIDTLLLDCHQGNLDTVVLIQYVCMLVVVVTSQLSVYVLCMYP